MCPEVVEDGAVFVPVDVLHLLQQSEEGCLGDVEEPEAEVELAERPGEPAHLLQAVRP